VTEANHFVHTDTWFETATITVTSTATSSDGFHTSSGSSTDTNCFDTGSLYGGGSSTYCNRKGPNDQRNTQDDTRDMNKDGAGQSSALGMAAIAAGMALVAAGMALLPPPTTPAGIAMIMAGMMLIMAGMAALAAAGKMDNNANKANTNGLGMDNLASTYKSGISGITGTDTNTSASDLGPDGNSALGQNNGTGIKIDPALLRTGKMNDIMSDMEKKTGLNRDDFAKALASGADPLAMLSSSPALAGKPNASQENLQKMMDDAKSKNDPLTAQEVMDKLGMTKDDLVVNPGGGGTRNVASTPNIDSMFPGGDNRPAGPSADAGSGGMKLSSELQAALDKNGITGRNIFEMVHSQYVKKTPSMFGVQQKKDNTAVNPFANGAGKMEL